MDRENFSPEAQEIFDELKPLFPRGIIHERWVERGLVHYGRKWYDLRLQAGRDALESDICRTIGTLLCSELSGFKEKNQLELGEVNGLYVKVLNWHTQILNILKKLRRQINIKERVNVAA